MGSSTDRTKRETPLKAEQAGNGCRKKDLLVKTSDLAWPTKVIKPESFNAYQCRGKCSLTQGKTFTPHSLLESMENKKGNKTDGEGCWAPTKHKVKLLNVNRVAFARLRVTGRA